MVDDSPEDSGSQPDPGRAKRAPPTIDLQATEVSGETRAAGGAAPEHAAQSSSETGQSSDRASAAASAASSSSASSPSISPSISPWVIAPISGAVAAALVITVGWMLGWPAVPVASGVPQINASAIDDLTARVTSLEQKVGKQDSAAGARIDALDKSLTALRGDLG